MEASWGGFCGLGVELERLGGIWKPLVDVLGGLGGVLKVILASLRRLEASWRRLGASWRRLGGVLEASWRFWEVLGGVMEGLEGVLECLGGVLEAMLS